MPLISSSSWIFAVKRALSSASSPENRVSVSTSRVRSIMASETAMVRPYTASKLSAASSHTCRICGAKALTLRGVKTGDTALRTRLQVSPSAVSSPSRRKGLSTAWRSGFMVKLSARVTKQWWIASGSETIRLERPRKRKGARRMRKWCSPHTSSGLRRIARK